jgi:hypothetical protein
VFEYVFLRPRTATPKSAWEIHAALASVWGNVVEAVTVAGTTEPIAVFVRCARELTLEERQTFAGLVADMP